MRNFLVLCTGIFLSLQTVFAQIPETPSSSSIYHALQKLNFLGNALYIAAHPDDENTRLISYLSNHTKARTAYLSITRGDGGQNLIGPELQELLGVLRTQELLAARRIDGGEQFFTRAIDFGYSKHPKETLDIWNKDEVLGDVVWIIRNFKPDVIINRFDHRSPGTTHGHHTSSAMLSVEAFDLAANPESYPEQLRLTETWQPKRAFFNTSWWFYGSQEKFEKADKSQMMSLDIGVYYPLKGLSNNEIASLASSQHLCQGFGRRLDRGSQKEYIELVKGTMPGGKTDIFEGINTSWSRIDGGEAIGEILYAVEENFNFKDPSSHLPDLLEAHRRISQLADGHWKYQKKAALEALIASVCGLYLEANATRASAYPGDTVDIEIEALNRSGANILLKAVSITGDAAHHLSMTLEDNIKNTLTISLPIPVNSNYTSPYWLAEKGSLGAYAVADKGLIGKPESPPAFTARFFLAINGYELELKTPVIYRYARPDKGELVQPFNILPKATVRLHDPVLIFADGRIQKVPVVVKAHTDNLEGTLKLETSPGWTVQESEYTVNIANKGDEKTFVFTLVPPELESEGVIRPAIMVGGEKLSKELVTIAYDHIPTQAVLLPADSRVVRLDIRKQGEQVGYIVGAEDKIHVSLKQIGYKVDIIEPAEIVQGSLDKYDAVVVGIRAYNVVEELRFKQRFLLDYVHAGGTLILQYNTVGRNDPGIGKLAPYPLHLSRDRVTDENSKVRILAKNHPLVQFPNPISEVDFDGWVQERGLYFPDSWGQAFTPVLSMQDEGEEPKQGGLLVAPYGKGHYIYTGLSFFRQLPAGVPGAYKLFANMISIGKQNSENENMVKG